MTTHLFPLQVFQKTRQTVFNAIESLTPAQLLVVPTGFANNIAWNLGHIIVLQQAMVYKRSGLASNCPEEMTGMYWANTSPSDWESEPDSAELIRMLIDHPRQLEADYVGGKFNGTTYAERTSGSGVFMQTLEEAMSYNNYHEGLHLGAILALKEFV